jgi:pre-rRNA-processing protein IPI1
LAYLTTFTTSRPIGSPLPQPLSTLLPKLCPLILDGSSNVRTQLLKLFRSLPASEIEDHVTDVLPYVRAGMTHLGAEIRLFAIDVLCWLLEDARSEVVSCAGGWHKTLSCFLTVLGWSTQDTMKWSSSRASFGKAGSEGRPMAKILHALAEFVRAGMGDQSADASHERDADLQGAPLLWYSNQHQLPQRSNAFGYLNLFGLPQDEAVEMLEYCEDRRRVFDNSFRGPIEAGLEAARKEGGEVGRAAVSLTKALS